MGCYGYSKPACDPPTAARLAESSSLLTEKGTAGDSYLTNSGKRAQAPSMASFMVVVVDQSVLGTGWEWCESEHSAVICEAVRFRKSGARGLARKLKNRPPAQEPA